MTKGDPNKALREAGGNYETANNANLSGNKKLLTDYNGSQIMREFSQKWEGNPDYTTNTKTQASQSLATINPNGPTGLVPQRVDQQYDGIQQLKKPLNFPNQKESDDYKDTFNPNK